MSDDLFTLIPSKWEGKIVQETGATPLPGAVWYQAEEIGDGVGYEFPPGGLVGAGYLTMDLLLDGNHLAVFALSLSEGETGPTFILTFGLLNQCSARLCMPLEAVNQNRWSYERRGAWLKPNCAGDRVDLSKVDRMKLTILRKSSQPVRWCMTPMKAVLTEPARLETLTLPRGVLLDELGQSTLHDWPGKSRSIAEVSQRLQAQLAAAPSQRFPSSYSRWGGWKERRVEATGYFRTLQEGGRWWLVDPDGYLFWSAGLDCVEVDVDSAIDGLETALTWLPDSEGEFREIYSSRGRRHSVSYLAANLIRTFGAQSWYDNWSQITLAELRRLGFNTVANWSDWKIASQAEFPYVIPMPYRYQEMPQVFRDFPDVFHPDFEQVAAAYAEPLRELVDDPAFIGYFLMNEPTWGFAKDTPATGMLFNTPSCHTRRALADFLRSRYGSDTGLSSAWGLPASLRLLAEGEWAMPLTATAQADLADFSEVMVEKFFGGLSRACKAVDPHHLNLGIRYYTIPPRWALAGMRHFDVFSMNCYRQRLPADEMAQISQMLRQPILVGEWHFGALDAGLPGAGIGHVPDQASRGKAYRFYLEDAAAKPWCVGVHYFILYDQSAIGRFDGENYNIGFLDVCNRPYEQLGAAAHASHERMYRVAGGEEQPYADAPEYLPLLFM